MICPCCGYNDEHSYNPSKKITELRAVRSRHTRKTLNKVVNRIMSNIPSDNDILAEYRFYQTISKVKDEIVEHILYGYLNRQLYLQGKGFNYLAAMIMNHNKNRDVISKNELLMRGKTPSVVKIKED